MSTFITGIIAALATTIVAVCVMPGYNKKL